MKLSHRRRRATGVGVAIAVVMSLSGLVSCGQQALSVVASAPSRFEAEVPSASSAPLLLTTSHTKVVAREKFALVVIRNNPSVGHHITFERRKTGSQALSWVGVGGCQLARGGRCRKTFSLATYGEFRYRAASAPSRSSDAYISNSVFVTVARSGGVPSPSPTVSPTPAITPTVSPTPQLYTDSFLGGDGNIDGQYAPSGAKYFVRNPVTTTGLSIVDHRLVRTNPTAYGPGAPTLMWPFTNDPFSVGAQFSFTAGSTDLQNVAIGTCATGFGAGSVQLGVSPTGWTLFYTYSKTSTSTAIVPLAQGSFAHPLATDGSVVYRMSMAVNVASSSVQITYPGGTRTLSDPAIAQYWGDLAGFQIRRPSSTDGSAQLVNISADAAQRQ